MKNNNVKNPPLSSLLPSPKLTSANVTPPSPPCPGLAHRISSSPPTAPPASPPPLAPSASGLGTTPPASALGPTPPASALAATPPPSASGPAPPTSASSTTPPGSTRPTTVSSEAPAPPFTRHSLRHPSATAPIAPTTSSRYKNDCEQHTHIATSNPQTQPPYLKGAVSTSTPVTGPSPTRSYKQVER